MSKKQGPSIRAQILGQCLTSERKRAKLSMNDAAEYLQVDQSTVSRMESALYPPRKAEVLALLDLYAVSDEQRRRLMVQLTEDIWRKGWWDDFRSDVDKRFVDYPWLETRATKIQSYEVLALSGLMQTKDYATAVISRAEALVASAGLVERAVELRMKRQHVVLEAEAKQIEAVIDESALLRPVGGADVMRAQLEHLRQLAKRPHVNIRVLPIGLDWHQGFAGPFTIFEMPDPYPDVAYTENLAGRAFVEEPNDVDRFQRAYDELQKAAYPVEKSAEVISAVAKDMK